MAKLPDYVASAKPNPKSNRIGWLTTTAATYAGIMLWFVFWQDIPAGAATKGGDALNAGGALSHGIGLAIVAVIVAAALCHFLFYLVPALLGMKTGLPLYIVGTSTYGVKGGFLMPGFLMGVLQFGWLSVNSFFSAAAIVSAVSGTPFLDVLGKPSQLILAVIWAIAAAFVGLKGIQYVSKVSSYMPVIPLVILLVLVALTIGGVGDFDKDKAINAMLPPTDDGTPAAPVDEEPVVEEPVVEEPVVEEPVVEEPVVEEPVVEEPVVEEPVVEEPVVEEPVVEEPVVEEPVVEEPVVEETTEEGAPGISGEEGDAGEEGDEAVAEEETDPFYAGKELGAFGVFAMILTYIVGFFATAGAAGTDFGMNNKDAKAVQLGGLVGVFGATAFTGICAIIIVAGAQNLEGVNPATMRVPGIFEALLGAGGSRIALFLLAVAAFPPACFSSFIAANSFKTTLPKTNPFISCGLGTLGSIILILSGFAGQAADVFTVIGASFGPICGAMMADYLLSGKKWAGPRAGFNPAGWISWAVGFAVGGYGLVFGMLKIDVWQVPAPPVAAFIVGFGLYYILAKQGMESEVLEMPAGEEEAEPTTEEA